MHSHYNGDYDDKIEYVLSFIVQYMFCKIAILVENCMETLNIHFYLNVRINLTKGMYMLLITNVLKMLYSQNCWNDINGKN